MSTECTICGDDHYAKGLCIKHYFRAYRHGSPHIIKPTRRPACSVCLEVARVLRRNPETDAEILEAYADLYLLFKTGSTYRLRTEDDRGREYDLEEELINAE